MSLSRLALLAALSALALGATLEGPQQWVDLADVDRLCAGPERCWETEFPARSGIFGVHPSSDGRLEVELALEGVTLWLGVPETSAQPVLTQPVGYRVSTGAWEALDEPLTEPGLRLLPGFPLAELAPVVAELPGQVELPEALRAEVTGTRFTPSPAPENTHHVMAGWVLRGSPRQGAEAVIRHPARMSIDVLILEERRDWALVRWSHLSGDGHHQVEVVGWTQELRTGPRPVIVGRAPPDCSPEPDGIMGGVQPGGRDLSRDSLDHSQDRTVQLPVGSPVYATAALREPVGVTTKAAVRALPQPDGQLVLNRCSLWGPVQAWLEPALVQH